MTEARKVFLGGAWPGGREEAVALVASGVAIEVVLGITSASACAATAGG